MPLDIYSILYTWETTGVFDLLLPFLLIFAIIFGVLSATNILGANKGIIMIISLVIALMALRLEFVSIFFTELFPRFAMGLVALIVVIILTGLFVPKEALPGWYMFYGILGVLIALAVIAQTFSYLDYFGSFFWEEYAATIIILVLLVAAIIGVAMSGGKKGDDQPQQLISLPIAPHRG